MLRLGGVAALAAALVAAIPTLAADSGSTAQQECDALASGPSDPDRPANVPGVAIDKIDPERAGDACLRAAKEHPSARTNYMLGRITEAAHRGDLAIQLYTGAAQLGHAPSQWNLGLLYYYGRAGVKKDDERTLYFFRKAAEQGYAPAQNSMGVAYNAGKGVEYDDNKAIYWFRKAAAQGNDDARENLATLEQFYSTHGGSNGVDAERQRQESGRRLRCDSAHLFGDPMARAMPGCY
jgi:TPR repeat protein